MYRMRIFTLVGRERENERERLREEGTDGWMDRWNRESERSKKERGGWMDRLVDGWMDGYGD